jgi:hypothetical protein
MRRIPPALLLLLLLALPLVAAAQVYTWTDAQGTPHYSDSPPPPGVHYQIVKPMLGTAHPQPAAPPKPADTGTSDAVAPATATTRIDDTPDNRAKLCTTLTANVALLEGKQPVLVAGTDGKQHVLSDPQRQQELAKAQSQLKQYCG